MFWTKGFKKKRVVTKILPPSSSYLIRAKLAHMDSVALTHKILQLLIFHHFNLTDSHGTIIITPAHWANKNIPNTILIP